MTHFTDGLRVGRSPLVGSTRAGLAGANVNQGGTAYLKDNKLPPWGKGMMGSQQFVLSIVPLTLQAANIAASQTPGGAGALTLTAGTGTTTQVIGGTSYIMLDVARSVSVTTAGAETANLTITGIDWWFQKQTATLALPGSATTANTTKTFLGISGITIDGATSLAITVGMGDTFGLIYTCSDKTLITSVKWNNTLALDTGTMTVADATSPATAATGDVRGTYKPSSGASDGSKRLTLAQYVLDPDTDLGLFGVVPA